MSAAVALRKCPECGIEFEPKSAQHTFCCELHRWKYRDARDPCRIANNRRRCSAWAAKHRNVKSSNPWLLGAPPFEDHIPGGAMEMHFDERITFEHRQLSALHGIVTSITGPHERNVPKFSLIPWHNGCGWGLYLRSDEQARELANTVHTVRLGSGMGTLRLGTLYRFRSPKITRRGHRHIRIDAITPVCVRCTNGSDSTYRLYTAPTGGNLRSTLAYMTPMRIGLLVADATVKLELVSRETIPATLSLAGRDGRLGNMRGWTGHCIVDTNAVGHWLLAVAERIGFGGTTSFGFGRIRVTAL
jgi:hypothetical protein